MRLGEGYVDSRLTVCFALGVDAVHELGELFYRRHLGLENTLCLFAFALRTEDQRVTLRLHRRLGNQVIRYVDLLHRSRVDISGQLGITEFFAQPLTFFVTEHPIAQEGERSHIEEDAQPSSRSAWLLVILLRHPPLILLFCHSYKISGNSEIFPSAHKCSIS